MELRELEDAKSSRKPEWKEKESITVEREFGGQTNNSHLIQFPQLAQEREGGEIA